MVYDIEQWSTGGDISMNHGAIVTCKWGWNDNEKVPVLLDYLKPLVYLKNDDIGKLMNSKSIFPHEIEAFSRKMTEILLNQSWGAFVSEHEKDPNGDPLIITSIEWANATANYRGSRKLASVVHGQAFAMIWLFMQKPYGCYFINPSLTKAFRGKEKITTDQELKSQELHAYGLDVGEHLEVDNKEGDIFDAIIVSLAGFLKHNSRLDEYVEIIKQERKELNNGKK